MALFLNKVQPIKYNTEGQNNSVSSRRGRGRQQISRGDRTHNLRKNGAERFSNKMEDTHPDLLDPKKVYVGNLHPKTQTQQIKDSLSRFASIECVTIIKQSRPRQAFYGFIQVHTEADVKILLDLDNADLWLNKKLMIMQPAKKLFRLPGSYGYTKQLISDRDYNLEPENQSEASIHVLFDDLLLKIFEHLPLKNLLQMERVCRRFQNLVYSSLQRKVRLEMKGDIEAWMFKNLLPPMPSAISKVLLICGGPIKELSLSPFRGRSAVESKFSSYNLIRVVAQLCPSLESLTLRGYWSFRSSDLELLVTSCTNIKKFSVIGPNQFDDEHLKTIIKGLPELEYLALRTCSHFSGKELSYLPASLKEFHFHNYYGCEDLAHLPVSCPNLEVCNIHEILIDSTLFYDIGNRCSNLRELLVHIQPFYSEVLRYDYFKNLKNFSISAGTICLKTLITSVPNLQELTCKAVHDDGEKIMVDFSTMKDIKLLNFNYTILNSLHKESLKTLASCHTLEILRVGLNNRDKDVILMCIRNLPQLKELDCSGITLTGSDIADFADASKKRTFNLKITIGMDSGALDRIEVLSEANYEISMFDAHDIFRDDDDFDFFETDGLSLSDDESFPDFFFPVEDFDDFENFEEEAFMHYIDPVGLMFLGDGFYH